MEVGEGIWSKEGSGGGEVGSQGKVEIWAVIWAMRSMFPWTRLARKRRKL